MVSFSFPSWTPSTIVLIPKNNKSIKDLPYEKADSLTTLVNTNTARTLGLDLDNEIIKNAEKID